MEDQELNWKAKWMIEEIKAKRKYDMEVRKMQYEAYLKRQEEERKRQQKVYDDEMKRLQEIDKEIIDAEIEIRTAREKKNRILTEYQIERRKRLKNAEKRSEINRQFKESRKNYIKQYKDLMQKLRKRHLQQTLEKKKILNFSFLEGNKIRIHVGL